MSKLLLSLVVSWLRGPRADVLKRILLKFPANRVWRIGDAHKGLLMIGSPGGGKTTAACTVLLALMRAGYGGLALVVKNDFVAEFLAVANLAGREADVVVLSESSSHRFNPFDLIGEPSDAAKMLGEITDAIAGSESASRGENAEWFKQRDILLESLCVVCIHLHGEISFIGLEKLYAEIPRTTAKLQDPVWRKETQLGRMMDVPAHRLFDETRRAHHFLTRDFLDFPEKSQGSVRMMVQPVLNMMGRRRLATIFGGTSTIDMNEVLNHRRMLLVDLSATSDDGMAANAILQYCFCKAAKSLPRHTEAFLMSDEFQETAGRELIKSLSLMRQYRVSPVMLSQSIAAVENRVGAAGCKTIVGLLASVVFLAQNDPDTREWAEKYVGKEWRWEKSDTSGAGKTSITRTRVQRNKVDAAEFAELDPGHTFWCMGGKCWRVKWPKSPPRKKPTIRLQGWES